MNHPYDPYNNGFHKDDPLLLGLGVVLLTAFLVRLML